MKKNKLLYILLIVLLISNAFFLFKHFGDKHDRRGNDRKGPRNYVIKELNFTEAQEKQYHDLRSAFFSNMKIQDSNIRLLKDEFYSYLSREELSTKNIDSLASLISEKEKQKDLELFNYLGKVRSMCDGEQKERLAEIIRERINKRRDRGRGIRRKTIKTLNIFRFKLLFIGCVL